MRKVALISFATGAVIVIFIILKKPDKPKSPPNQITKPIAAHQKITHCNR